MLYDLLLAKTGNEENGKWLPLSVHLRDTAGIIRLLASHWLSDGAAAVIARGLNDDEIIRLCVFSALTHDLGKATPLFQAKGIAAMPPDSASVHADRLARAGLNVLPYRQYTTASKSPHALAGETLLLEAGCDRGVAAIVGAHHGRPSEAVADSRTYPRNYYTDDSDAQRTWRAAQSEIIACALAEAGYSDIAELPSPSRAAQVLLSGLLVMADWIASNTAYFPLIDIENTGEGIDSRARARTAWRRLNLPQIWRPNDEWREGHLYQMRFGRGFTPRAVQRAMLDIASHIASPGLVILEAPMGVGKTEAALAAAEIFARAARRSGVFFALPTQATANGIFPRVLDWARKESEDAAHGIRLAHAMAQFNSAYRALFTGSAEIADEDGGVTVHQWFGGRKTAMLADFVIGTIDQLLLAALTQKHVMLRHLGLANKVVVIDECHAYDAYMGQYLERALEWLGAYRVPVIVLSATLPIARRQRLVTAYLEKSKLPEGDWRTSRDYPLITYTDGGDVCCLSVQKEGAPRKVSVIPLTDADILPLLSEKLAGGGCAGVIVNTVRRAQALAAELRTRFGEAVVVCHASFVMPDRSAIEEILLRALGKPSPSVSRPERLIVVGTQVLEQSLDIDFDVMITDLCPMDLLLQRIGRLFRHERPRPAAIQSAACYVLGMDDNEFEGGARAIYGDCLLMRAKAFMPPVITLPDDISPLVQDAYDFNVPLPREMAGYPEAERSWLARVREREERANTWRVHPPEAMKKYPSAFSAWLPSAQELTDREGEAAVRDGSPSIDVLLMRRTEDGAAAFLPWIEGGRRVSADGVPSDADARAIAMQRIRLPHVLCAYFGRLTQIIETLEARNKAFLPEWQRSPWLKGELVLLLDERLTAELCGFTLRYDRACGLTIERGGEDNVPHG